MLPSNWFENSPCKGCECGERVTGGVFCVMTQDLVSVGYQGCKAQDDFYEEQYKRENGITLTELAKELRKLFRFKYLTVSEDWPLPTIIMWGGKVEYDGRGWNMIAPKSYYGSFNVSALCSNLDLSEYTDENGNIDYSKCIVEVE